MQKIYTLLFLLLTGHFVVAQIEFTDVTLSAGIQLLPGSEGIAVGDFNNDGYDDFYVSSIESRNSLYQNNGDGTFNEVAENLGLALGEDIPTNVATWGDINNDGWLDLYVGNRALPDLLFLNLGYVDGEVSFQEISFEAGIYQPKHPKSVNMADVNNDGFLDIYISNFASENALYLNNQNNTFTNYIFASGALDDGEAMGTVFFDYDKDGDVDLYLVHDSYEPNLLYQNDGTGSFTEVGAAAGVNTESFGMGVDIGDVNNDGWMDIYVANFGKNFLLLNNTDGTFSDISENSDVADLGMGWGSNFLDYNMDGLMDIYVTNTAFVAQNGAANILYTNLGNLSFEKKQDDTPICSKMESYGAACLDYDLDGNLDVLVANRGANETTQLLQNEEHDNNWVGIKLIGTTSNRNAIGAKVTITDNQGNIHYREMLAGQSWASQNSSILHFGVGDATAIDELLIQWTSGLEETFNLENLNQYYTITEGGLVQEGVVSGLSTSANSMEGTTPLQVSIFPNPSQGDFTIKLYAQNTTPAIIEVMNAMGQSLLIKEIDFLTAGENVIPIQFVSNQLTQFISIRISTEDAIFTKTAIILQD